MDFVQARQLVKDFEAGILPKDQWTHTAHFVVALCYCMDLPLPEAVEKIRNNIKSYNVKAGGQNTDTSGYHETITLFYMSTIAQYLIRMGITQLDKDQFSLFFQQPFLDRSYPLQFYSREYLMSVEARKTWMPPDRQAFGILF
jgi:hypothetical protein